MDHVNSGVHAESLTTKVPIIVFNFQAATKTFRITRVNMFVIFTRERAAASCCLLK